VVRDSVVGITTRYGLDGPEFEKKKKNPGGGEIFRTRPDHSDFLLGYSGQDSGHGLTLTTNPQSSAEFKERV